MNSRTNRVLRGKKDKSFHGEGPNWILIAGGALLSTLSIRFGYKLKRTLDCKQQRSASNGRKGNAKSSDRRRSTGSHMHSNMYSFTHMKDGCFNSVSGNDSIRETKHAYNDQMLPEPEVALPLVSVPVTEMSKENGIMWASSPDRLELPPKPLHHSTCSDSPCVSESGSDIFSKREVIQKLRQQLKRRDDMILEMHDQILELKNSLNSQTELSTDLQSRLDAANGYLFDSKREIQRLRKAMADHYVQHVGTNDKLSSATTWPSEVGNGSANGHLDGELNFESMDKKGRGEDEKVDMLKMEVGELKEVIQGKDYLLQSYKEQKEELSMKIRDLQQRLDSQLPNIL